MPLYRYQITTTDGQVVGGQITAKTEVDARERLIRLKAPSILHSLIEMNSPAPKQRATPLAAKFAEPTGKSPLKLRPRSKLERLLYLQSDRCFFCGQALRIDEASIEHLNPKSRGGTSDDNNVVVCHASLNQTFGDMDLKRKFEFTLRSAGAFKCPPA
jgi:hypothetical protein